MCSANNVNPGLFGQKHSNRDYTRADQWGKNMFNSSFPASLLAYMSEIGVDPIYLKTNENNEVIQTTITPTELLGIDPLSDEAFYSFEKKFSLFEQFYSVENPQDIETIDLVMSNLTTNQDVSGLEIKLTALPDSTTRNKTEDNYGCEIVVRPPTICYLACTICANYQGTDGRNRLHQLLGGVPQINHWEEANEVLPHFQNIKDAIMNVSLDLCDRQTPLIVQPIWKTVNSRLANDCLDVFVWSNLALIQVCCLGLSNKITRPNRTIVWIYKMLLDYTTYGRFDYIRIVKNQSYGNANDKAFSASGTKTHRFMSCDALTHPRISKSQIREIILGGGQNFLEPERRFDAVIVNSSDIF